MLHTLKLTDCRIGLLQGLGPLTVLGPDLHAGRHIDSSAAFTCFGLRVSSSQVALEACIVLGAGRRKVGKRY